MDKETKTKSNKKINLPVWSKVLIGIFGSLIGTFALVVGGGNIAKYAIYSEYYRISKEIAQIPGINSGTTPQGLAFSDTEDVYLTTSYSCKGSYLYAFGESVEGVLALALYEDDNPFTGHVGGVATSGSNVYIADGGHIYVIDLDTQVLNNTTGQIDIGNGYEVNNNASFVFANEQFLYVGEFHDAKHNYVCEHPYGENNAIVSQYNISFFATNYDGIGSVVPLANISIRDQVQGFAVSDDGTIILSTSYGIASSRFFIYEPSMLSFSGEVLYSAPLLVLDTPTDVIQAPPMMEDLDFDADGNLIVFNESACNKYIFGKFFFADKIMALDIIR